MGIRCVAIYTPVDARARHVELADTAVPVASYLDPGAIVAAARGADAEAIHPGYGFLAERAEFADACIAAGITFIGPSAAAMRTMGDKAAARARARDLGVPCIAGYDEADQSDAVFAAAAERIGFPVMVKARAGGGGRGIRRVGTPAELADALRTARSEANAAFGDGTLFLERAIDRPRHIEVQVFGDTHGNVIHLGARDCSVQRRHQKLIEEAPAPGIDAVNATRLGEAAVTIARSVGYVGAGTVEFLVAGGAFHFLEMNTRLQVEHPVTEALTGLDLVEWQLRVAMGERLPLAQDDVRFEGHAIEARLCAEDPARGFAPASGPIAAWRPPAGVRVDHGLHEVDRGADRIPADFDSLVAKLIATGPTRESARMRLVRALAETTLLGIRSNRAFLMRVLEQPEFVAGAATTALVDAIGDAALVAPRDLALAAALLHDRAYRGPLEWRNWHAPERGVVLECGGERHSLHLQPTARDAYRIGTTEVIVHGIADGAVDASVDGTRGRFAFEFCDGALELALPHADLRVRDASFDPPARGEAGGDGVVRAGFNGRVAAVHVTAGETVRRGAVLVAIEAMKMEQPVLAPIDGTIEAVHVSVGQQVSPGLVLMRIIPG